MKLNHIYQGDTLAVLKTFPPDCIDTVITSPPYWGLRDYGVDGQIGLEKTIEEYLDKMLDITQELQRMLKPTGVMFWNHGDSYASQGNEKSRWAGDGKISKSYMGRAMCSTIQAKCLMLQNYRLILKMIDEQGWILRNSIIWHKPNAMPSSVKDRFSNSYEPVFMLVKKKKYWFDLDAVRVAHTSLNKPPGNKQKDREDKKMTRNPTAKQAFSPAGKNPSDLWKIATHPFPEAHFATFPPKLIEPMIKAGCPKKGVVLDPFMGAGTTGMVAKELGRNYIGTELSKEYIKIAEARIKKVVYQPKIL